MNRTLQEMLEEYRSYWKHYVFQSVFATLSIFIILLAVYAQNAVVSASIGSTAFIVFTMPKSVTAKPRNVIGGHLTGFLCGWLCSLCPDSVFALTMLSYAVAVGLSIFLMVVLDMEHPPASGTALGVAITGFAMPVAIALLTASVVLSIIHLIFKKHIRNLI
jgi:CBS-domain-containing membrane protein